MQKFGYVAVLAALLSACGGGGGSTADTGGSGVAPPATLPTPDPVGAAAGTFSPAKVSAAFETGTSTSLTVAATIAKPADFAGAAIVYAYVVDDTGVILPDAQIFKISDLQYSAVLRTAPSLAPGSYKGNFKLKLCRDSACASHFPGSPALLPYEFSVAKAGLPLFHAMAVAPLDVSLHQGGLSTPKVLVNVNAASGTWSVKSDAGWLKVSAAVVSGSANVEAVFDPANLQQGKYTATLTVSASDGRTLSLPASLTVLPNAFVADKSGLYFSAINGAPIAPQAVKFVFDSAVEGNWNASGEAAWLSVSPGAGVTPGGTAVTVNPAIGALASGTYTSKLKLTSPVAGASGQVPVELTLVKPTLSVSSSSVTLGGPLGRSFASQALTMNLNTAGNAWPWTLSAPPAWVSASKLVGTVNQADAALSFAPNAALAPVGSTTAMLNATVKVNGDTVTTPIALTINKDQRKMLASETGVALTSTPGWSRLSRTLTVSDNFAQNGTWTAQSDKAWLSVTASGTSGGNLTLTANPATLPQDTISYATITLGSTNSSISAPEPIKVALWKGTVTPVAMAAIQPAQAYISVVADPIRPLVYVHKGASSIDVYHVYTAQKIATISSLATALGDMAISPNGDLLYALEMGTRNVAVVDLSTQLKINTLHHDTELDRSWRLKLVRPNGVEILLLSDGGTYLARTGRRLGGINTTIAGTYRHGGHIAASKDGKRVYFQNEASSSQTLYAYTLDYSDISGGTLFSARQGTASGVGGSGYGKDLAVSADGTHLYTATGYPYLCSAVKTSDLSFDAHLTGGDAYPVNVEVGSDGRIYCGAEYSSVDIWVHRVDGTLQTSYKIPNSLGVAPRQLAVSGDGLILVALTGNTDHDTLAIIPVGF